MSNVYNAPDFTIDTDVAASGLAAIKGSAVAATDNIIIKMNATTAIAPTFTIDQDLTVRSIVIGYTSLTRGTGSRGKVVVNDNVNVKLADVGYALAGAQGSSINFNGTLRSIGTSNGAADQSFAQRSAYNRAVAIDGVWWRWVPALTGERVAVTASTNTTTITCTTDPRKTGLYIGAPIEIRTRSTGALVASKTVTVMTATSVGWASGNVSVTANESVYLPIAADEKVYTISGGNVIFGDGNASAYNNNGGAIPANGATIQQCGITLGGTTAAGCELRSYLKTACSGVEFYWLSNATNVSYFQQGFSANTFTNCAFRDNVNNGLLLYNTGAPVITNCVAFANGVNGITINQCPDHIVNGMLGYANVSYALLSQGSHRHKWYDAEACYNGSHGMYTNSTWNGYLEDCLSHHNGGGGILVGYGCSNVTVLRGVAYNCYNQGMYCIYQSQAKFLDCVSHDCTSNGMYSSADCDSRFFNCRQYSNTYSTVHNMVKAGSPSIIAYRSTSSGDTGQILWNPVEQYDGKSTGSAYYLDTKDEWLYSSPSPIPGLASYSNISLAGTSYNGSTATWQWRYSHDNGRTWSDWATFVNGQDISAVVPDLESEMIQFRVSKTDSGTGAYQAISANASCTFATGWTCPASWSAQELGREEL